LKKSCSYKKLWDFLRLGFLLIKVV